MALVELLTMATTVAARAKKEEEEAVGVRMWRQVVCWSLAMMQTNMVSLVLPQPLRSLLP